MAVQRYSAVLDHTTYQQGNGRREYVQPYEVNLTDSIRRHLYMNWHEYKDLAGACKPLLEKTKQSTEINEEDHGKAILIFTGVTIIFLPLSFVTSYLGMNTADIRSMDSKQTLFWIVSLPLTCVVMAIIFGIAYSGDDLRDLISRYIRTLRYGDNVPNIGRMSMADRERIVKGSTKTTKGKNRAAADEDEFESPISPRPFPSLQASRTMHVPTPFPNQTSDDSTMRPAQPSRPSRPSSPTYIRVDQEHIDIRTLNHYRIPWEYDTVRSPHSSYFRHVRTTMARYTRTNSFLSDKQGTKETDALFEHTRRLRKRDQSQHLIEDSSPKVSDKREYTWVRRRLGKREAMKS